MIGPSTRNLLALPAPPRLRQLTRALALLDEILSDPREPRYYTFDPAWNETSELAAMHDDSGDQWFLWFGPPGLVLLGLAHEAPRIAGIENFPSELLYPINEPALGAENISFVIWRRADDDRYFTLDQQNDRDGSADLLGVLDDEPTTFARWASEYYDCKVDLAAVTRIYAHEPLDAETVKLLRRDVDFSLIAESARAMGYPVAPLV